MRLWHRGIELVQTSTELKIRLIKIQLFQSIYTYLRQAVSLNSESQALVFENVPPLHYLVNGHLSRTVRSRGDGTVISVLFPL